MRIPEPCLCGDPYCRRCFPGGQPDEGYNWIENYFEGKRCATCPLNTTHPNGAANCKVLLDEADIDDCPALAAQEAKDVEEAEYSRWERNHE